MQGSVWRSASIVLGVVTALLGMYGAFQFGLRLEGGVSYLRIAAPVIAGAAAIIPPLAEHAWRARQHTKSVLWWAVLVPAAATVFFGAAERVHVAKAGAEAERSALRNDADRAGKEVIEAKEQAHKADAEALKAEARKTCGAFCREAKLARDEAHAKLEQAKHALLMAEAKATTEASLTAPEWLLPAALDLIAFMAIWTGLTGQKAQPKQAKPKPRKRRPRVKPKAPSPVRPTDLEHLRLVQ
jgi:hypothetical protein